jgi:hypothetical protein
MKSGVISSQQSEEKCSYQHVSANRFRGTAEERVEPNPLDFVFGDSSGPHCILLLLQMNRFFMNKILMPVKPFAAALYI